MCEILWCVICVYCVVNGDEIEIENNNNKTNGMVNFISSIKDKLLSLVIGPSHSDRVRYTLGGSVPGSDFPGLSATVQESGDILVLTLDTKIRYLLYSPSAIVPPIQGQCPITLRWEG